MRIRQAIVPIIVALGMAGSILAGSAVPVVAAQATTASGTPNTFYHT
jgi:hypothetical protein